MCRVDAVASRPSTDIPIKSVEGSPTQRKDFTSKFDLVTSAIEENGEVKCGPSSFVLSDNVRSHVYIASTARPKSSPLNPSIHLIELTVKRSACLLSHSHSTTTPPWRSLSYGVTQRRSPSRIILSSPRAYSTGATATMQR